MLGRIAAVALVLLIVPFGVEAAKVKSWNSNSPSAFDKATLAKTAVSSQGIIRLARDVKLLANLDVTHVWDLAEGPDGVLYAATGKEDGKVFRIGKDGSAVAILTLKESQILSLAVGADGSLFAGAGPKGKIVRIDPKGTTAVIADNLGSYVWSLAHDPISGAVYAGTGPKGIVYRIGADSKAEPYYTTKQDHVMSLASAAGGILYAGVDKQGLVYRIDGKNKGFVVYAAAQSEVRSLVVADDAVYAGTSEPGGKKSSSGVRPPTLPVGSTGSGSGNPSPSSTNPEGEPKPNKTKTSTGPTGSFASDDAKGTPASSPSLPSSSDNSLFRIGFDGSVREIFRDKTMILRVLRLKDRLLVGTGMHGQLFEVNEESKEKTELARLDHGQVLSMLKRRDGSVVIGTGDPGKLYVLENRYAAKGTLISETHDAKISSKWGSIHWAADVPKGTSVSVAVRSGNVADPDETWSDWSAEQSDPAAATAAILAAGRYLQYRVTLTSQLPDVTPEVRQIVVRYKTTNQAPEIATFDVPDLDAATVDSPKKLKLKWTAVDPNEDELNYRLYVRKKGWQDWVMLEENLEKKEHEWDATTMPSGMYQAKIVASDRRDNPPEESLTGERISPWFAVSNEPPVVTAKVAAIDAGRAAIEVSATASLVRLTEASYSIDGSRWSSAFPADGIFDSKTETLRIRTESLRPGIHVAVIRVRDAAGNVGSGDVVFRVPEPK